MEAIKQESMKKMELFGSVAKAGHVQPDIDKIVEAVIRELKGQNGI